MNNNSFNSQPAKGRAVVLGRFDPRIPHKHGNMSDWPKNRHPIILKNNCTRMPFQIWPNLVLLSNRCNKAICKQCTTIHIPPSAQHIFHDWRCGSQLVSPSSTTLASNALPGALTARSILLGGNFKMGGKARMGLEPKWRTSELNPPTHQSYSGIVTTTSFWCFFKQCTTIHIPPSAQHIFHDWRCGSQLVSPSSTTLASNALPGALTARSILFDLMRQSSPFASRAMSRWMTTRRRNFVRATTVGQNTLCIGRV